EVDSAARGGPQRATVSQPETRHASVQCGPVHKEVLEDVEPPFAETSAPRTAGCHWHGQILLHSHSLSCSIPLPCTHTSRSLADRWSFSPVLASAFARLDSNLHARARGSLFGTLASQCT